MTKALIGAGCFWGIEEYLRKINGIISTKVGYSGGITDNPTYQEVCSGNTNHAEVVLIEFSEELISFKEIINFFWEIHDPTQLNRQGPDIGTQYRSVIFYYDENQKMEAIESMKIKQNNFSKKIVTEISPKSKFYMAEDYHQMYIKKTGSHCHI